MFRTFLPSVSAVLVASALSGAFTALPAMAATDYPVFDRASVKATIQPDAIHVVARGEDSYTAIREKNLTYNVSVRLDMARGRLRNYTISPTGIAASAGNQGATFRARGLSEVRERHALKIQLRDSGDIRNHIIAQCNNLLAKGADESRRHETSVELPVTLSAVAGRRGEDGGRNRRVLEVTGSATARVICHPLRRARPAAVTEVFLDAPERVGKFCPQDVSLKTWVFSDKPGEFSFRVVREDGSASQPYKIVTERHDDGKVFAQARYTFTTKRPVDERFRVEVDGQQTSSSWLRVNVPCRRKPEQVAAFAVEDSTVKVKQSNSNSCPQTVVLTTRVRTNRPGKVKFRMEDDSGWTSDTFTARSVERPNGRFVAVHERKVYFKQTQRKRYRETSA